MNDDSRLNNKTFIQCWRAVACLLHFCSVKVNERARLAKLADVCGNAAQSSLSSA
jgi:hypothetical protein